ncbi:hypothetical protein JYU34_008306 [Plutella xylostella]|uniref:Uncharacterized protein n=1 Tax=Plutella xylostella TaxID=51655 RepID=A0ABQ7QP62_PLUXY|nr:hypothetical protein JYU34_008306 [Plutella xylostella]
MAHDLPADIDYTRYTESNKWATCINNQNTHLQIVHMNVSSFRKHFNEVLVILQPCLSSLDIMIFTEVNLKQEELCMYNINGFNMNSRTRQNKRGGGIIIYSKQHLPFTINNTNSSCELVLVHGKLTQNSYKMDIFAIYGHLIATKTYLSPK